MGRKVFPSSNLNIPTSIDIKALVTASTTSTVLDLSTATVFKVTLAANTSISFVNAPSGTNVFSFSVIVVNDATANRTLAWIGSGVASSVKFAGGLIPPKATAAAAVDVWTFYTEDGGATYVGSLAINDAK